MSLPTFPDVPKDFTCENSISQILTSIAMEEIGLSHIINAEGEKLQYILGTLDGSCPPAPPTIEQVVEVNQSVKDMLQQVAFNQMFLSAKMSDALKACLQFKKYGQEEGAGGETGNEAEMPSDPDKKVTLSQPNHYTKIKKGGYFDVNSSANIKDFESSSTTVITGSMEGSQVRVHAIEAGAAFMAIGNNIGALVMNGYQVYDPDKISEYVLKNGGKVFFENPGQTKPCPVITTPVGAQGQISWVSLNPGIAEVMPNGDIKSIKKGSAVIIGSFTDTWGVKRDIIILAGVGVQI
jgi:hypothetical protein